MEKRQKESLTNNFHFIKISNIQEIKESIEILQNKILNDERVKLDQSNKINTNIKLHNNRQNEDKELDIVIESDLIIPSNNPVTDYIDFELLFTNRFLFILLLIVIG